MDLPLRAVYIKVPEGYIAFVEGLAGVNAQGETLKEVRENLAEAIALVRQANEELAAESAGKK
ncbi:MAG: type II toxin-antitoxin system HicB family antitoxin [Acidobacteria bacterium]|nr:type II toxin-antitoxin system HicB family antitoxin [Acidobacteriota bacterium]